MLTSYCFDMKPIPTKCDMIFITVEEKYVLSLYAHGFNAICFNIETSQIPERIIESFLLFCRHIILLYDANVKGVIKHQSMAPNYNILARITYCVS